MSELLGTEERYWKNLYEKRFMELSYRVMKKAGINSIIIDSHPMKDIPARAVSSAMDTTILVELYEDERST